MTINAFNILQKLHYWKKKSEKKSLRIAKNKPFIDKYN